MRAVDTNVVARFLLNDDPGQAIIARAILSDDVFVPPTVLLEVAWLLGSRYRFPRTAVAALLGELIDLPSVTTANDADVRWAIGRFAEGGDFADLLHLTTSGPADAFATFDIGIAAAAGANTPIRVETLA